MFPKPQPALTPNTYAYESSPLVKPTGFREYDARWLFGKEINLMGIQALGMGLGALIANSLGIAFDTYPNGDQPGDFSKITLNSSHSHRIASIHNAVGRA